MSSFMWKIENTSEPKTDRNDTFNYMLALIVQFHASLYYTNLICATSNTYKRNEQIYGSDNCI